MFRMIVLILTFALALLHRVSFRRKKNKEESPGPKKEEVAKPSKKAVEDKVRTQF